MKNIKHCIRYLSCALALLSLLVSGNALAIPEIQHWQSKNGAKVLFIETRSLPMVDIKLLFAAGSARDGKQYGLALLTNSLMTSGAGQWNADQIAEQLDSVGAQLDNDSARDMGIVSLRSLSDEAKLDKALAVLQQVLSKPRFSRSDLERDRKRLLAVIKQKQDRPSTVASQAFYHALYQDHPYAHPSEGTEASIKKITRKAIKKFFKRYYVAANATVVLVGNLSRAKAEQIVEQLLQDMPKGQAAAKLPAIPKLAQAAEKRIQMPTVQTHIKMGQAVLSRHDPDYFALYVGNHILGGSGFGSRLMQAIREERGLAYDAHSYFYSMQQAGPYLAGVQTRNERAAESRRLLVETIERFVQEGPSADEVDKAIKNITGSFPLNIDSNADLLGYLGMIGFYNLPLDYLDRFTDRVRSVTAEKIQDAFQRRLHPDKFVTVIVGDAQN